MAEYDNITFEKLPEAVSRLLQDVADIKNHLLNTGAYTKVETLHVDEKDILTVDDICKKLGMSKGGLYNLTHTRQIPYLKRGGRIYFDAKEIDSWIRSDRRKTIKQLQEEANIGTCKK